MPGVIIKNPDSKNPEVIDSKKSGITLESDSILRCQMPGAGGYGDPKERDRSLVFYDLEEGYISKESGIRDYGMTEEELANIEILDVQ